MDDNSDQRGRRAPTPKALASLGPVPEGFRILPDPLHGQPLLRVPAEPALVRLLLDRSRESAQAGEPTQDYLALRFQPSRLSFAVTDGVGSSFLGDVAAQILAAHLSDWLASPAAVPGDRFDAAIATFLAGLSREVVDQVAAWPLPDSVSTVVRAALDQQRAYGSEAMFACAVVDLAGGPDATVTVAWLGDTHVRVFLRDGRDFDHSGQTNDRWSSRLGPRGTVGSRTWPAAQVARVIAYTDGLLPEVDATVELADAQLVPRLEALARRPGNDDMALVDVALTSRAMPAGEGGSTLWRRLTDEPQGRHARTSSAGSTLRRWMRAVTPAAAPAAPVPAPEPPARASAGERRTDAAAESATVAGLAAPGGVGWARSERGVELTWSPVAGAQSYAVQVCREPSFAEPLLYAVADLRFAVPPLPGPVFVRLRSVAEGGAGPWGGIHRLSAAPQAAAPQAAAPQAADPHAADGTR